MKNTSFYDRCMFLFEEMGDFGSEERKNIDTLKEKVNKRLVKLQNTLYDKHSFDEAESIISLIMDYAEVYAKQHFVHGVEQGVMLCKELNKVDNTF